MRIRQPKREDLSALSDLCLRSKGYWGYDDAFLEACRAELTLTPQDLDDSHLAMAETDQGIVGVVQVALDGTEAEIDKLFVDPQAIGGGYGRALFTWAVEVAKGEGARRLVIEADPDAAPFYRRMGAYDIGFALSGSMPGRQLPKLALDL